MIWNHELAAILPQTRFGLAVYDRHNNTAEWVSERPEHPEVEWAFFYGSASYWNADARAYKFNESPYTEGFHWKVIPYSPESLKAFRLEREKACSRS